MNCNVCSSPSDSFYKGKILNKYFIEYFKCKSCGFIQTEKPYWLNEAYADAIAQLDIGMLARNIELAEVTGKIISTFFGSSKSYLDHGGGYGIFTRLMRDKGFDFYRFDTHCENIFAKHFDLQDVTNKKFDVVTAFEVFEHLPEPMAEVKQMLTYGKSILLSTIVAPATAEEFDKWWYRAPLSGQHVSFYTLESLRFIAKQNGKEVYSNNQNLHLITDEVIDTKEFAAIISPKKTVLDRVAGKLASKSVEGNRKSLLESDYKFIENLILKQNQA